MTLDELKRRLQEHVADGLLTIVGSGLSVAEGIPGMGPLAEHLLKNVPDSLPDVAAENWSKIAVLLRDGVDLESALGQVAALPAVETVICSEAGRFVEQHERKAYERVFAGEVLRFSRLLNVLRVTEDGLCVVTTNYDRLIELAAEAVGIGVDCSFAGDRYGRFAPVESRHAQCIGVKNQRKKVIRKFRRHIRLFKPHGSLDWYTVDEEAVRCGIPISAERLMITPGSNKYLNGYERPFDAHISGANRAVDDAQRFLILGYGFNDLHLQTHLQARLKRGDPAVIVTHGLTDEATKVLEQSAGTLALTALPSSDGVRLHLPDGRHDFPGPNLWDLDHLLKEVWKK